MIKNKKGYLLIETIMAITVVATAITYVYGITMNNFIKQNNDVMKFNTTDGLYVAREVEKLFEENLPEFEQSANISNYVNITNKNSGIVQSLDINKIYFSKYDMTSLINNEKFPISLRTQLKSIEYEAGKCNYRYLIIFNDYSYSTIGVECN